jgi:phosphodiesterase/alkaline phosphatase D-like protein
LGFAIACAIVTCLALLFVAAVQVSDAEAAYIHPNPPSEAFGTDGTEGSEFTRGGGAIAVDPVRHRLYAIQNSNATLYAFDVPSAGTHTPAGGNFPIQLGTSRPEKTAIAVDNASGNFYTVGVGGLQGFTADGEELPNFPITSGLSDPCGVGTDAEGNIWLGDQGEKQIREYDPEGDVLRVIDASSIYQPEFSAGTVCRLAVERATGDLYFSLSPNRGGNRIVWRMTAANGYSPATAEQFVTNPSYPGIEYISIDSSRHIVYLAEGSKIDAYNTSGALIEEFATAGEGPNGPTGFDSRYVAIDESSGTVYATVFNEPSHAIQVIEPEITPDALTGEPIGDSQVSATVGTAGGPAVTDCQFEWGPTSGYGETPVPCSPAPPYGDSESVTAELPGLSKETTYHYRVVVSNENGTNIGIDKTITPHYVPFLRTLQPNEVERTCATLNGAFEGNGEDTHYNFEWGTGGSYGNKVFADPGEDAGTDPGPAAESYQLCGLDAATTYHYRFTGVNGTGSSSGRDVTFTTDPAVIGLSTDPASQIGGIAATINGSWTGDGTPTSYDFEWGFSKQHYENSTPIEDGGSDTGPQTGSADISGLFQNTVYHYRIVATNSLGTTYGKDGSFRTLILAKFTYRPTNHLTTASAELHATVNPENAGPTTYHFEYGPTDAYGLETPEEGPVGSDDTNHPVSKEIDGLEPGQTYHFRVVANSPAGVSYGEDQTFTTVPNLPTVVSASATGVGPTEATLTGEARPGFGPTVIFFRYGTEGEFTAHTLASEPIGSDDSPHVATFQLTGLLPGTTYDYRAVAVNVAGSSVGPVQTFTTSDKPAVDLSPVSGITETTATLAGLVNPSRAATTYHFEYGTLSASGSRTAEAAVGSDGLSHAVSAPISGLAPGTTYSYRVVAINAVGSSTSREGTFTTVAAKASGEGGKPARKKCKKGFVKRHGKCVKKHKRHHKKHDKHKKKRQHGKGHHHG